MEAIIRGYDRGGEALVPRFEAIDSAELLAPVAELLPAERSRILDVGAGTGRDAAWLAARGHEVTAVEPVETLRTAGMRLHAAVPIAWIDDRLPGLDAVRARGERFDRVLLVAVWQHISPEDRDTAIHGLAALIAPGGRLILSVRHGPGAPDRPCFPADVADTEASARAAGLVPILHRDAPSVQEANRRAGVTWTWLGFAQG